MGGDFQLVFEKVRPDDGSTVRRWVRWWYEPEMQEFHSEDRYEIEREGAVTETEWHRQSPEGRWYTQAQAIRLFEEAGFTDIRVFHGFTREPVQAEDRLFCVMGTKPTAPLPL